MPSRQGPDDQSMAEAPADGTEDNGAPEPVETAELGPQRVRMVRFIPYLSSPDCQRAKAPD